MMLGTRVDPALRAALTQCRERTPDWDRLWTIGCVKGIGFEHHIECIRRTETDRHGLENCHAFAFRLFETSDATFNLVRRLPDVFPDGKFVAERLIPLMTERVAPDDPKDGDVAVYFQGEAIKHSGRVKGQLIQSKWNASGHLWQHGVLEVETAYGDVVRYFQPISSTFAEQAFLEYAGSKS
jgi:hypothetical protein